MKNLMIIALMAIVLLVAATAVAQAGESAECAKCKQENEAKKAMRLPPKSCPACNAPAVAKVDPPKEDKGKKKPEKKVEKPPQDNGGSTMADLKKALPWILLVLLLALGVIVVRLRSRVAALEEALQVIKRAQDEFPNARFL